MGRLNEDRRVRIDDALRVIADWTRCECAFASATLTRAPSDARIGDVLRVPNVAPPVNHVDPSGA